MWIWIVGLVVVFAILAVLSLVMRGSVFGKGNKQESRVIDTTELCPDVEGFNGPVPVKIYLKGDIVEKVEALPNEETESFFGKVMDSGLLDTWNGMTVEAALSYPVDAVSGATYSSSALIENVRIGLESSR